MQATGSPSPFSTTFVNETPPPIQQEGKETVLNYTLTIPEAMFLAFIKNMVQSNLDQKKEFIYLGTSEPMQRGFNEWVAKTFTSKEFSAEDLNLVGVISSIWIKTKTQVENELKTSLNQESIEDEKQWQGAADSMAEGFRLEGKSGKIFTARQASFLITAANNIRK